MKIEDASFLFLEQQKLNIRAYNITYAHTIMAALYNYEN
jgi:hypothetical protein